MQTDETEDTGRQAEEEKQKERHNNKEKTEIQRQRQPWMNRDTDRKTDKTET